MTDLTDLTATDLRALRTKLVRALAMGERSIRYLANGVERSVEWRRVSEMREALAAIDSQIATAEGRSTIVVNLRSVKGFA